MATKIDFSTPDIPMSEATFYVSSCTRINAPASLVFRTLRNTETWKDWNRWIPRVTITYQPDDEDDATVAEIEELVRNTSIAVSYDSEITDGAANPDKPPQKKPLPPNVAELQTNDGQGRRSSDGFLLPPVTRQRLASNASRRLSEQIGRPSTDSTHSRPMSPASNGLSGAQKYQAAQEARKSSITAGTDEKGAAVMLEAPGDASMLMPAPRNTASTALALSHRKDKTSQDARRKSSAAQRRQLNINALYGEPSVRIQVGTKMTFYVKMKLPHFQETRMMNIVVSEVSRPDDPLDEPEPGSLARANTHTSSKSGAYRLVWAMANAYNPPRSFPKFLLQAQRVHEIRPIVQGDGKEVCEYWDWECQRGMLAKKVKKDYSSYIQERMKEWGERLGSFCESMGGAVERRDFSVA
ncbi:hypothetical protein LTR10_017751 [Elasticomyces elasticus]|uniref:Uncharacterized protein n=1 Tax=Exophiala sideris TaxID=1016849 RepID=A0ABR0JDR8_9EURO|nr:hypothetical protein LTR10_017751 [Elasticomyces elasticus]KAK5031259.1 hypothetical protein LTS07_004994 [Exophiala sideris]KAK5038979.1 hypothetical protein LTR13_004010 [Exophiala sideris]KAK5060864.1 hypothetical protein LTR69_005463 [Exophiala sideris]KAK5183775.1 hypothetical protein LTR44_004057 [Eurotiomycetes sp. CCFEE 6388]